MNALQNRNGIGEPMHANNRRDRCKHEWLHQQEWHWRADAWILRGALSWRMVTRACRGPFLTMNADELPIPKIQGIVADMTSWEITMIYPHVLPDLVNLGGLQEYPDIIPIHPEAT